MTNKSYNPLSPEEKVVIEYKGTERPFTGEYDDFYETGTYVCRKCDSEIYRSVDKWDTDAEIPRAARIAGVVSLLLWAAVVSTGRLIAYSGLVPDWWKALNLT